MARSTRRTAATRTARTTRSTGTGTTRRRSRKGGALPLPRIRLGLSAAVARSLIGIAMLVLGAILLIAMALPGEGQLTDWIRDAIVPYFGAGRWLLPFVLLIAGWYVEWGPGKDPGAPWARTLLGISLAYAALLGIFQLIAFSGPANTGGRIGAFVEQVLVSGQGGPGLLPVPAAFVILLAALAVGLMLAFDLALRQLLAPLTSTGRAFSSAFADARTHKSPTPVGPGKREAVTEPEAPARTSRGVRLGTGADSPDQAMAWGAEAGIANGNVLDEPPLASAPGPISRTVVTDEDRRRLDLPPADGEQLVRTERAAIATLERSEGELTALEQLQAMDWTLPGIELLEARAPARPGAGIDHATNISRIEEKLRSFAIPAKVVATNSGPVVTQYEVKPEHHVKLSRIEALADDLAMALAARSIRIEAPIPGKSVVGIEIPNQAGEVVGFKPLLDETGMLQASSQLTFAPPRPSG